MKSKLTVGVLLVWLCVLNFHPTLMAQPVVTTLAASGVTVTNATLQGTVNPNGNVTTVYFQYGLTTNYGSLGGYTVLPATNVALPMTGLVVSALPGMAGTNWTLSGAPAANWTCIASSADGTRLAAGLYFGSIYISTNGGSTWVKSDAPTRQWQTIACSADGTRLAAGEYYPGGSPVSPPEGSFWTSTNGGLNWSVVSGYALGWLGIASSADGVKLATVDYYSVLLVSTNGGASQDVSDQHEVYVADACSADGSRVVAVEQYTRSGPPAAPLGGIWISSNSGATITRSSAPSIDWLGVASSADGLRLAAVPFGKQGIWTSINGGLTWANSGAPPNYWRSIASSADGTRLVAGSYGTGTGLWASMDGGASWTQSTPTNTTWTPVSSADGTHMAAIAPNVGIYTSTSPANSLAPGTVYHYRLAGINSAGTTLGSDLTFTTGPVAPTVTTLAASGILGTTATLNGVVNPNGAATTVYVRYGLTTNYGSFSITNSLPATNSMLSVSNLISSLSPLTTYHYQLVGTNSVGTSLSGDMTFTTTALPPDVTMLPASDITATNATLNGVVNPNGAATTVVFFFGLTTNYNGQTDTINLAATNTPQTVSIPASDSGNLSPGTTYHYRIAAANNGGTSLGVDLAFTTLPAAPAVTILAASDILGTTATLSGVVNPNGAATTVYFRYGLTTNYGSFSITNNLPATNSTLPVSNLISSLSPLTTYHYQLVGMNGAGTSLGGDMTFTTPPLPPDVTTLPASGITATNVTLNGTVNPNGAAANAAFFFGPTTNYGRYTDIISVAATNTAQTVSLPASDSGNLSPATVYHYSFAAANDGGTSLGVDLTFTTLPAAPSGVVTGSTPSGNYATISSTVNPNGLATTAYVRYGLTTNYGSFSITNSLPATNQYQPIVDLVSNLAPVTTYHFQLVCMNSLETNWGSDMTFTTTILSPDVTTLPASDITTTNAILNGTVNPNGTFTLCLFQFGFTTAYEYRPTGYIYGSDTNTPQTVTFPISDLTPGTTYHFQFVGINDQYQVLGGDQTFTTAIIAAPTVTTLAASGVTTTNATLNGEVNPNWDVTTAYFQYGLTTNYGNQGGFVTLPATNATLTLTGLVVNSLRIGTGTNWTPASAPAANWQTVAASADGTRMAAVAHNGGIYLSTDSGSTWTQSSAPVGEWFSVASSADGARLAAVAKGSGIYTSTNSGITWVQTSAPTALYWYSIASSADGSRLAAAVYGGSIYTSTNSGSTWNLNNVVSANWYAIASSADGTRLAAAVNGGGIYLSTNSGGVWTPANVSPASWSSIASSAEGSRLAAVVSGGGIYTSTDYGNTWTPTSAPNLNWFAIASSSDGMRLAADVFGGGIYISTNSGLTWITNDAPSANWSGLAISADGSQLAAAIYGGGIYTPGAMASLLPGTTYHFRLMASSSVGANAGGDLTFTTTTTNQAVNFGLTGATRLPGGAFRFSFTNLSGIGFTVLGTTNLTLSLSNWTVLGAPIEAASGQYQFTDPQATNRLIWFYRIRSP